MRSSPGPPAPSTWTNVPRKVTSAYLLADPAHKPLKLTQTGSAVDIQLPAKALDPIATVVVLETAK